MRLLRKRPPPPPPQNQSGFAIIGSRKELENCRCVSPEEDGNTYRLFGDIGNFLTVDPGLGGTGWALWSRDEFGELVPPIDSGSVESTMKNRPWWWHASNIAERLYDIKLRGSVFAVYVEQPKFMEAGRGLAAARDGDLVKLTTVFGAIMGKLTNSQSSIFCPVPIVEWNGNMPKEVSNARVRKKLPGWRPKTKTTHEIDAVGIGLFVKGFM